MFNENSNSFSRIIEISCHGVGAGCVGGITPKRASVNILKWT
jgi:hypothetical protein